MSVDTNPHQNNPYQERPKDKLTLGEALRVIAERTPFRTEAEGTSVLAAIDKAIEDEQPRDESEDTADETEAGPDSGTDSDKHPTPVKATPAGRAGSKPR